MRVPSYVSRMRITRSIASQEQYTVEGMVITGPNTGRYIVIRGETEDDAVAKFVASAERVKREGA